MKAADKRGSEYKGSLLERLLACYLSDNPGNLQYKGKTFLNVSSLTSESLRVVPMHCKTSAICSASGDSESQIRPTLTTKTTENVYIHTFVTYYWYNHKLVVTGDSDYLMQQWMPFPFLPFLSLKMPFNFL